MILNWYFEAWKLREDVRIQEETQLCSGTNAPEDGASQSPIFSQEEAGNGLDNDMRHNRELLSHVLRQPVIPEVVISNSQYS